MPTFNPHKEDFVFWKNIILVAMFLTFTPVVIITGLFSLTLMKNSKVKADTPVPHQLSQAEIYAPYIQSESTVNAQVGVSDARVEIIKQYMESYNSPLAPFAAIIVQDADMYDLDFRLVTAIAQQESNLCKVIPPETYNCWGWGITSVGTLGFDSYEDGIDTVSKGLRTNYYDRGYTTIEDIMSKYTPNSNGSWANGVKTFMTEME